MITHKGPQGNEYQLRKSGKNIEELTWFKAFCGVSYSAATKTNTYNQPTKVKLSRQKHKYLLKFSLDRINRSNELELQQHIVQ
jgi:hypothetical protein